MHKVILVLLFVSVTTVCFAQAVVLRLDTSRARETSAAFDATDKGIHDVLVQIGHVAVSSLPFSVRGTDLPELARALHRLVSGSANAAQPITLREEVITVEDALRMAASAVIVAPSIAELRVTEDEAGSYACDILTSFAFIAPALPHPIIRVSIDTHGYDRDRAAAIREAVDAIPPRFASVLDEVPYLRPNWGIIEVRGNEVVLELGRDAGILPGDEFAVLPPGPGPAVAGQPEKGLLMVRKVDAVTSIARIVYSDAPVRVGDRLLDLARVGTDSTVYVHSVLLASGPAPGGATPLVGLRQSFSRGFYRLRPFVGIEVPFNLVAAGIQGVPINLYAGAEYTLLMGRFQLAPRAAIGFGASTGLAGPSPDVINHAGGSLGMAASYLLSRDIKAEIDTGWLSWVGFSGSSSYGGAFLGGGLTVKY